MHEHLSKRGKVATTFMVMLLAITFTATFLPKATATPTLTISINPISGTVGTEVEANGTIDTLNGSYTIRWDGTLNVTTGYATGYNVTTSFVIPQTVGAPSGRNVNIELIDNTVGNSVITTFTLYTKYHIEAVVPSPPFQLQEGGITDIMVNVAGGEANTIYFANITLKEPPTANLTYWATVSLTNTTTTGYGEGIVTYPLNFSAGAHMNYTGIYNIAFNETIASGNFTVGLTNATEYHRFQVVGIRATGYTQANESVWVNITNLDTGKVVFSENVSAVGSVIEANWAIPSNASMGNYTVTLTNSTTPSTFKPVPDNQTFKIVEIPFQVQTVKLDGEALAGVKVEIYNTTTELIAANKTDEDGLASFSVEGGGNYSLNAYWNLKQTPDIQYVLVGTLLNQTINRNVTLTLLCWIAYLRIAIDPPLPFIDITLTYQGITKSSETNITEIWEIRENMPTNISYTIEARRYNSLFNTTHIEKLPAKINASWVNITIICPTYTMFVHVVDSKEIPLQNVEVAVYEWSSGVANPIQSETTDDLGSAVFNCIFGKYKIWVYNEEHTIVLNKTVVELTEDQMFFVVHCKIFNVDLSVIVKDYFGQPIPNALVKVEREFEQKYVNVANLTTAADGTASLPKVGGKYQIFVYIANKLYETKTLYLDESKAIQFKIDRLVIIGGYLLEITQLIAYVSLCITVTAFVLALIYRRLRLRRTNEKK